MSRKDWFMENSGIPNWQREDTEQWQEARQYMQTGLSNSPSGLHGQSTSSAKTGGRGWGEIKSEVRESPGPRGFESVG